MLEAGFTLATEPARARQHPIGRHATRRFGYPQDIEKMATWLASEEANLSPVKFSRFMAD